jgi:hypothetical protein
MTQTNKLKKLIVRGIFFCLFAAVLLLFLYPRISKPSVDFLREYVDKYPRDVNLLDNPHITKRLEKLLGIRYAFLKEAWTVESPMQIDENTFIAGGCMEHNCGDTNFIIVVDLAQNLMYVGIREDGWTKVYSEDGSTHPYTQLWEQAYEGNGSDFLP